METTPQEQALEAILSKERILIALSENPSPDAVASGLALTSILTGLKKNVTLASSQFVLPATLGFLPRRGTDIQSELDINRKLIVTINLNQTKVGELSYGVEGDALKIFITPKSGTFDPKDVAATSADYSHDLIITLDVQTLASLGKLFETNAEFFYHTPILNIDHHPTNESFGQINLVDLVATSTAEIVLELLKQLKPSLLDDAMATNLLTGIITKTRCFRAASVTPKVLAAASQLIEAGAKREEIIKHLYQTHSLPTLRLWGRALARLKDDWQGQFVWTLLNQQDFEKSGANEQALEGVIDELIVNMPRARIAAVLSEPKAGQIRALLICNRQLRGLEIFRGLDVTGTNDRVLINFSNTDLSTAEAAVVQRVGEYLQKQQLLE